MTRAPGGPRFQIRLIDDLGDHRSLVALGQLADELGFDSLMFPHSPFRANSWVLNSAIAQSTKRIQLSAAGPIHTTDPSEIATYVAALDEISGGRVSVRLGAHNFDTLTWTGLSGADVVPRVREVADLLRRLFRGEAVPHDGPIYHWTANAYLRFTPYRAEVPIWVTPIGDELLELSGEIGDGTLPMVTPPESAALIMEPIVRGLRRSARPDRPFAKCAFVWLSISEDGDGARERLKDIVAYYGTFLDPRAVATLGLTLDDFRPAYLRMVARDRAGARAAVTERMLRTGIAGTPAECVRRLRTIFDAGFDHVSLGGPLGADAAAAMRLVARKVIPEFR